MNLAKENGFQFSVNDLVQVIDIFEKHRAWAISEAEFSQFINSSNLQQAHPEYLACVEQTIEFMFPGLPYQKTVITCPSTPKSTAQVVQFMEKTGEHQVLQQELKNILGVGDGDISTIDELDAEEMAALKSPKNSLVVQLAAKYNFYFSKADLNTVLNIFEQQKLGKISPAYFVQLTGISDQKKETSVELVFLGRRYRKITQPNGEVKIEYLDNKKMRSAKYTAVISFMLKTAEDAALKQEVASLLGVVDGDISSIMELDAD